MLENCLRGMKRQAARDGDGDNVTNEGPPQAKTKKYAHEQIALDSASLRGQRCEYGGNIL